MDIRPVLPPEETVEGAYQSILDFGPAGGVLVIVLAFAIIMITGIVIWLMRQNGHLRSDLSKAYQDKFDMAITSTRELTLLRESQMRIVDMLNSILGKPIARGDSTHELPPQP